MVETPKENHDSRRWEFGLKVEILEFHASLQLKKFLNLINTIKEVLAFKEVCDNKRIQLITTRFHEKVVGCWQQTKLTQARRGKAKLELWKKLKKHMCVSFLLHNYIRVLYHQLQKLRQGMRMVDEYAKELSTNWLLTMI